MSKLGTAAHGFIVGAAIIPAIGIMAHVGRNMGEDIVGEDYSLAHRFETAYCFHTPKEHKEYTVYEIDSRGNRGEPGKDNYLATPWLMWPLTLLLGAAGAADALAREEREAMYYKPPLGRGGR